ncbi:hypothetical protein H8356DRAFT_1684712 [Neocallimastix lanati (nom. inval.)]|nr:hypothetical protein H8356DRAFT_1684712 [Neocallimastix sp. JGI-2020a]
MMDKNDYPFKTEVSPSDIYQIIIEFFKNKKELSDDVLEWLYCNYADIALDALNIIDKFKIQKIISNSNQILYRVNINKFEKVICLPEVYYCSCDKYITEVIVFQKENMCAHLLSSIIAHNIPINIDEIKLSNEDFAKVLMSM